MTTFLKAFINDESGASAAEYALILAVVGVAIGAGALVLGQNIGVSIDKASDRVRDCGTKSDVAGSGAYADAGSANCTAAAPATGP
ncbi:MAG: Flp family type IVb pilin [Novosphingobium sp.]|nr:Flp family type IVb pilin [Novosphingobium sp.]